MPDWAWGVAGLITGAIGGAISALLVVRWGWARYNRKAALQKIGQQ